MLGSLKSLRTLTLVSGHSVLVSSVPLLPASRHPPLPATPAPAMSGLPGPDSVGGDWPGVRVYLLTLLHLLATPHGPVS